MPHPYAPTIVLDAEGRQRLQALTRAHTTPQVFASFVVPTGEVVWDLGVRRTSVDFAAHVAHVASRFADQKRFHWVLDNLNTHWSLPVCELRARLNGVPFYERNLRTGAARRAFLTEPSHNHVFHFTPQHGSWHNQVELWFNTLARRWLKRGDFASAEDVVARLQAYMDDYNTDRAHPYRWTYTGQPLVRATPFNQTRRQQRFGRALAHAHSVIECSCNSAFGR